MHIKKKKFLVVVLAAMLGLSGCGSKTTVVDDYGQVEDTSSDSSEKEAAAVQGNAGMTLTDMLGGSTVSYKKDFSINGKPATIDVVYAVNNDKDLPIYKVEPLSESNIDEATMVKNLLGDKAIAFNTEENKYLNENKEDSHYLIRCNQAITYHNHGQINFMSDSCPGWQDESSYYIHNYEGSYNGVTYQLLISYSKLYNEMSVCFFPKSVGELAGDSSLKYVDTSSIDGKLYEYYKNNVKIFDLDEAMGDRPNLCNKTDDELMESITTTLKDTINTEFPKEGISFYDNLNNLVIDESVEPRKCEAVFLGEDSVASDNLEGAVRDGYCATVMMSLNGYQLINDSVSLDEDREGIMVNTAFVNDSGTIGFNLAAKYSFKEKLADSADIMSFEKAMDSFVEAAPENLTSDNLEKADGNIEFSRINLVYFPVISAENSNEITIVPAWSIEADNKKKQTIVRVLINATDGSFISAMN